MTDETVVPQIKQVDIEKCVIESGFNTRKELGDLTNLTASIKELGIQEPLAAVTNGSAGSVVIFKGFRRLAAALEAGLKTIPVIVHDKDVVSKQDRLIFNLVENIQREELNPVDEAEGMLRLQMEYQLTEDQIVKKIGVKKTRFQRAVRLVQLREVVKSAVREAKITSTAALNIDRLPENQQGKFVEVAQELSGERLGSMIDKLLAKIGAPSKPPKDRPEPDAEAEAKKASVRANVKTIKQAGSVICTGLGYVPEVVREVDDISWGVLTDSDVKTAAKLFDDIADTVADDVPWNDKGSAAIESIVSETPANRRLNIRDADIQEVLMVAIRNRAVAIAEAIAEEKSTADKTVLPKVTFATAKDAIDEFYEDVEDEKTA